MAEYTLLNPLGPITVDDTIEWTKKYFQSCIWASAAYLAVIFGIKWIMKNRKPFNLKMPLAIWNFFLSIFSATCLFFTAPELLKYVMQYGLSDELCAWRSEIQNPWCFLFTMSKFFELGDTLFIVLRKKPLIFLHYYHHVLTLIYTFGAWGARQGTAGSVYVVMNTTVHTIMYAYYGLCALGARFPRPLRMCITGIQIVQMFIGTAVSGHNVMRCESFWQWFAFLMYLSYVFLFLKLFVTSYIFPKKLARGQKKKT